MLSLAVLVVRWTEHPRIRGRVAALFVAAPAAHLLTLALMAPRRPEVPPRYLLPLVPILLVAISVAFAWSRGHSRLRVVMAVVVLAWAAPGVITQVQLFDSARMDQFSDYRPHEYLQRDIGHVTYETAPAVNRFLEARGSESTAGFNFSAGIGASDDLVMEGPTHNPMDPRSLVTRRESWIKSFPMDGEERRTLHENIGWGLAVFAPGRRGVWHAVLSGLPEDDRRATARGLGIALSLEGPRGCDQARNYIGSDREALWDGIRSLGEGPGACREIPGGPAQ